MRDYETQLWRVLNPERKEQVHFHHNSEWLEPITFSSLFKLADAFSVNTFIKRELISNRLSAGGRVSLREMLYPLMQGYDSVHLSPDVEIGGSDQWFNMLAGRTLMAQQGMVPQAILAHRIVAAADGQKMSSSRGNVITLNQDSFGLFTQMMQIPDQDLGPTLDYYPAPGKPFSVEELNQRIQAGENPRDLKLQLAERMTALLYGDQAAQTAVARWQSEASERQQPTDLIELKLANRADVSVMAVLVETGQISSKSELKRLIEQKGLKVEGTVVQDPNQTLSPGQIVQIGRHRFFKIGE
jgi:tyrosyl-tRNA synthetase